MSEETRPPNFGFGEEEQMLRDLARKFLDEHFPVQKLRDQVALDSDAAYTRGERSPWDESVWKQMVELGWTGLAVPEAFGGADFSLAGVAGLVEEVGRHALPSPLITTLIATYVLRESEAPSEFLKAIAAGQACSLALTNEAGDWDLTASDVVAEDAEDGLLLNGQSYFVQDAFKSDFFVVHVRSHEQRSLCIVPRETEGLQLSQDHILDLTRDQATLAFKNVKVPKSGIVSRDASLCLERAWPSILVLVAADLCGSAEWQLMTTVKYAQDRSQFDRPLGFFQAVKHPLVNAMVEIDHARSLLYHAACEIDHDSDASLTAARMAKSQASDAGAFMSDRSIQLHGGYGFTWEADMHLYFKRSLHNQALYGDGAFQRAQLAETLIEPIARDS